VAGRWPDAGAGLVPRSAGSQLRALVASQRQALALSDRLRVIGRLIDWPTGGTDLTPMRSGPKSVTPDELEAAGGGLDGRDGLVWPRA
jgi:hypothetical protein